MRRSERWPLLFIGVLLMFAACADRPTQWGVLLWSFDEEAFATGEVVAIYGISQLNSSYSLRSEADETPIDTEQWRVVAVRNRRDAEKIASEYETFARLYGVAKLDGLAVRESPNAEANRLYKLRLGEVVKIVDRGDLAQVGEYEGYWYSVISDEGVSGFTFSEFLSSLDVDTLGDVEEIAVDEFLEQFFSSNYRPDVYRDMLRSGKYDLDRFLPEYGIFPDRENQRIVIVNEDHESEIEYDGITRPTEDSYAFEGSTLILFRVTQTWINLIYSESTDGVVRYSEDYVYFPDDIDMLTIRELERREELYEQMRAGGGSLESAAYGTIELGDEGAFQWNGFERLVPDIVPTDALGSGIVEFSLYVGEELQSEYDGAIAFVFDREDGGTGQIVRFLYSYGNGGIRFAYSPETSAEESNVIDQVGSSIILFFQYQ